MKTHILALSLFLGFSTAAKAELARFLYYDQEALQARTDLIQQAKKEILVEYFAVTNDDISTGGVALLCEASKRGVIVKILLDGLSSHVKDTTMAAAVNDCKDKNNKSNIEFRLFNPWDIKSVHDILSRDHDKMLAVDGKVMIIGGRNVDAKYFGLDKKRNFKDLDILIGGQVVKESRSYFNILWDKTDIVKKANLRKFDLPTLLKTCETVKDPMCSQYITKMHALSMKEMNVASLRLKSLISKMKNGQGAVKLDTGKNWLGDAKEVNGVRLLANSPTSNVDAKNMNISDDLYSIVSGAQRKVLILSPYLIPTARAKKLFEDLIRRGVSITIITNSLKSTDNLAAQAGFKHSKNDMIEMGIELYEYNLVDTSHAKTAVIDDEVALIGTYNLDPRSSQINREIGLVIKDTLGSGIADELTEIINKFKAQSLLVGKDGRKVNEHLQDAEVGHFKKGSVKVLEQLVPLFKNQL